MLQKNVCLLITAVVLLRNMSRYLKARKLTEYWNQHFTVLGHLEGQVWTVCPEQIVPNMHRGCKASSYSHLGSCEPTSWDQKELRQTNTRLRYSQPPSHDSWSSHLYNIISLLAKRTQLMIPACFVSEKTSVCVGHTCTGGRDCFHELYP